MKWYIDENPIFVETGEYTEKGKPVLRRILLRKLFIEGENGSNFYFSITRRRYTKTDGSEDVEYLFRDSRDWYNTPKPRWFDSLILSEEEKKKYEPKRTGKSLSVLGLKAELKRYFSEEEKADILAAVCATPIVQSKKLSKTKILTEVQAGTMTLQKALELLNAA